MEEYTENGCLSIVESAFKRCLNPTKNVEEIKGRLHFVENGALFKLWCLLDNKDHDRLKTIVTLRNHRLLNNLNA